MKIYQFIFTYEIKIAGKGNMVESTLHIEAEDIDNARKKADEYVKENFSEKITDLSTIRFVGVDEPVPKSPLSKEYKESDRLGKYEAMWVALNGTFGMFEGVAPETTFTLANIKKIMTDIRVAVEEKIGDVNE